ncbi:VanZ family protein [Liquorilactobacillus sicerae]|uniref:VanZ family protein n=1 Tax=Liquorilactobacillus sicerae TaxID=1416943 RepID=UPI0024800B72|nr:VanZ family protein [Liquorilactobacillus sicerae]
MKSKNDTRLYLLLALLVMGGLFISSSMTYQQQTSVPFLEKYLSFKPFEHQLSQISFTYAGQTISIAASGYYKFVEFFMRKAAHFFIYLALGAFFVLALRTRLKNNLLTIFVCTLMSLGYAALDEFHEMLTGDRTPLFQDVILDGFGALTGILLVMLIKRKRR